MSRNPSADVFRSFLLSAGAEARRRGDRRIGTEHLLLGLLYDASSPAAVALGVSLADLRRAAEALDVAALAAVGVEVESPASATRVTPSRHLPPLTSGARAVIKRGADAARPRRHGSLSATHFLLALLELPAPDPAAALLDAAGVDRVAVRRRLNGRANGHVA